MNLMVNTLNEFRAATTGSRVSGLSSSVLIVDPRSGVPVSADVYKSRIKHHVQARLDYITSRLNIEPLDADMTDRQLEDLWEQVYDFLESDEGAS